MSIFIQETHPKIRVIASVNYAFVVSIENTFCQLQSDQRILFRKTGVKWTLHDLCHGSNQHYHPVFLCPPLTNFGYESNPVPVLPLLMPWEKDKTALGFFFFFFGMWGRYESNWLLDYLLISFTKVCSKLVWRKRSNKRKTT